MMDKNPQIKKSIRFICICIDNNKQEVEKKIESEKWKLDFIEHFFISDSDSNHNAVKNYSIESVPYMIIENNNIIQFLGTPD